MHILHLSLRIAAVLVVVTCARSSPEPAEAPEYSAFGNPRRVTIQGYQGDAMEPFITRDSRYLFFNNLNDPAVNTNLHYAERLDALTFEYRGEIRGANTTALDAVPSMDTSGTFYFVSTRSYPQTLSTIYRGRFFDGVLTGVDVVPGISKRQPGSVNFDVEVSPDGGTLYFVDGIFRGGPIPEAADLAIAIRHGATFERVDPSTEPLQRVNTADLEYAAAVSADGLEMFFTRLRGHQPCIYRTTRRAVDAPFEAPARVRAIEGFVEAPTLSPDGRSLYYHKKEGSRFAIFRVSRP